MNARSRSEMKRRGPVPAAKKRRSAAEAERPERPSDDPEVVRQLSEENVRKAADALRALKLPNHAEPCTVFKP